MASVNLRRRAEIGRQKRARTRAAILDAARARYADVAAAAVTVEAITGAAGIAKGTFYLHFRDMAELEAELGNALIAHLAERHEPARRSLSDPLARLATAATIFLRDLAGSPSQARLVARAIATLPDVAQAVQARLMDDLAEARSGGRLAVGSAELATRIVVALVEQAAYLLGNGRIGEADVPDVVRAALRALGCDPAEAAARCEAAARDADRFAGDAAAIRGADKG